MNGSEKDTFDRATQVVYSGPPVLNEIVVVDCQDWKTFQEKVKFTRKPFGNRVFRGQREANWKLKSKWDRYREQQSVLGDDIARECRRDTPQSFLEAFKNNFVGNAAFSTSHLNEEEWMSLGRHHGLITPLLDWTKSPYVAAYFAFKDYLPIDEELGCLNPHPVESDDGNVAIWELPIDSVLRNFKEFSVVQSRNDSAYRQQSQSGLFSLLSPKAEMTLDDFLKTKNYQHIVTKYLIPKSETIIAMHDLHLMNINEGTMFPDADGAAAQANLGNYMDWLSLLEQNRR